MTFNKQSLLSVTGQGHMHMLKIREKNQSSQIGVGEEKKERLIRNNPHITSCFLNHFSAPPPYLKYVICG